MNAEEALKKAIENETLQRRINIMMTVVRIVLTACLAGAAIWFGIMSARHFG